MHGYQEGFDSALRLAAVKKIVDLIASKAKTQGVILTARHQKKLQRYFMGSMTGPIPNLEFPGQSERHTVVDLTGLDIQQVISNILKMVPDLLEESAVAEASHMVKTLMARWPEQAERERVALAHFELNILSRWGRPLGLLAMMVTISREFGGDVLREIDQSVDRRENLIGVLIRLHARACQVAEEVIALLKAGLADGALARCRTLHEIAVTSSFILEGGEALAERYALFEVVESREALKLEIAQMEPDAPMTVTAAARLGDLDRTLAALRTRFGPAFTNPNGWAAASVNKEWPKFADIEREAQMSYWRRFYKLASLNVHSNARAMLQPLGMIYNDGNVLLSGHSNAGLALPGQLAAVSLLQTTLAVSQLKPSLDSMVVTRTLGLLGREIDDAFATVEAAQIRQEHKKRHRRKPTTGSGGTNV